MKKIIFVLLLLFFIVSCTKDKDEDEIKEEKEFIYTTMYDNYFWDETIPEDLDLNAFDNLDSLLTSLRYTDKGKLIDRWSYFDTLSNNNMYYEEGEYLGFGFSMKIDLESNSIYISYTYPDSPADIAGLKRGSVIHKIEGKTISEIETNNEWETIFGEEKEGAEIKIEASNTKINNETTEIKMIKSVVKFNTVFLKKYFTTNDKKVAYMIFDSFITPAKDELEAAFLEFKQNNVEELILDLRYNGGGYVNIASDLSSYINSEDTDGKIFQTMIYDSRNRKAEENYMFYSKNNSINVKRVIILTTENTASASEAVINSLKPFIEVVKIGKTTHGKPVGMNGYINNSLDLVFWPVTFKVKNALGEGDYFDGIKPDKELEDDINFELGDPAEPMLREALHYIEKGFFTDEYLKKYNDKKYKTVKRSGIKGHMNKF